MSGFLYYVPQHRNLNAKKAETLGIGYAFAGGLMFAASVYNLLLPAFTLGTDDAMRLIPVIKTLLGLFLGCAFLWGVEKSLTPERLQSRWLRRFGGRVGTSAQEIAKRQEITKDRRIEPPL